MSSGFEDYLEKHQRLAILKTLVEAANGSLNDSVLQGVLCDMALGLSRDQLRSELAWLAEQRLVVVTKPLETVTVAQITERGIDVARGISTVPGIQRPSPAARVRPLGEA